MTIRRKYQLIYILLDALAALLIWLCFLLFRWMVYEGRMLGETLVPAFSFWTPLVIYPLACLIIYYLSGYYLSIPRQSFGREFLMTFLSSVIISLGAFFIIIIDDHVDSYTLYLGSLLALFLLQFVLSYLPRLFLSLWVKRHVSSQDDVRIDLPAGASERELYEQICRAYPTGKDIFIKPTLRDIVTGAARIRGIRDEAWICISEHKMHPWELCHKRAFDVCVSLFCLVLFFPVYVILAVMIYCSSPGPIIYHQTRIGLHGKPFDILKFRTMYVNAEDDVPHLTEDNDPRITSVGKWLRRYRLDELPQFWNVLKGEMSIVGPRPERAYFIRQIEERAPYYCLLYKIRPGLTSWGPIKVGYTDTVEKMITRLQYDLTYMENMSIGLDLKIIVYTFSVLFKGKGK